MLQVKFCPMVIASFPADLRQGIHGLPLKTWPRKDPTADYYCAHGNVTFSTWHTPYMALYEQRLYEEMNSIIKNDFNVDQTEQQDMQRAADTWRLPFWDWAMKKPVWKPDDPDSVQNKTPGNGPNVPFIITQKQIEVRSPGRKTAMVPNPMFNFALPVGQQFGDYDVGDTQDPDDYVSANE